jgi:hypothetical protein
MTAESSPLVLQQKPIWTVERDLAASAVRVSTGEELTCLTDQRQGTMAMKHVATASVSRDRPGGAHVVTRTEIRLRTRLDQEVLIESASDVGQHGATLYGHVRVDDQEVFQQTWRA